MGDPEVRLYTGCDPDQLEAVLTQWPHWDDTGARSTAAAVIHGCL